MLLSLGDCHRAVGRLTDAIQHSQRAQAIFREAGDRLTEGLSLNSLGLSYGAASQALKAIEQHRAALDIFRVFDDPHGEALSLLHLGDALHANGESDRARDSWSEALGILDRIGAAEADSARRRLRDAAGETS